MLIFQLKKKYEDAVNGMSITTNSASPFTFAENVEIKDINFIYGTNY